MRALKINTSYRDLLVSLINSYFIFLLRIFLLQRCCNLGVWGKVLKETRLKQ